MQSVAGQQGVAYHHIILLALSCSFRRSSHSNCQNCCRRQPHSHLRPQPRGTPRSIRIYLILPETTVIGLHFCRCMYGSIFIQICAVGSGLQKTHLFCNRVRFGRSGSSKVNDFGTNRKRVYDFLLVRHCDYGTILHRFQDTETYWLKIAYFSYPSLIRRPRSLCSLWNFAVKLTTRKLKSWGYPPVKTP